MMGSGMRICVMTRLLALLALALVLAGCGYSLRGSLPGHIRTVAVPVFANKTQQPAVENFLTRAVVDAFVTSGRLKVVRPEEADSILEGRQRFQDKGDSDDMKKMMAEKMEVEG